MIRPKLLVAWTFLPIAAVIAAPSRGQDMKPQARQISVNGSGRVSAPPNVAEINLGVVTQGKTAREALSANNESMTALQNVLKERGVAAKDLQTTNITISPRYSQPPPPNPAQPFQPPVEFVPKIIGYDVTNTVHVTVRDLPKLGEVLDAVVTAGANQMHGISFRIDAEDALMDTARKKAMADARKKAELMAGEAGVVVGPPISIRDETQVSPPRPQPMLGRAMMAASVPVASGEQELSVVVHVVYELRLPKND